MSTETPRPITSTEPDALDIEASQDPDTTTDYYYGDDTESTVRTKDVSTTRDPGYVFVNERNRPEWLHKLFGI